MFGLSPNDPKDINIGQQWERILSVADHIDPMVYPSHYLPTHLRSMPTPNKMPYETVFTSVGIGVMRHRNELTKAGGHAARVIPWLQAFSAPWSTRTPFTPEQAAAQIKGVYDTGLEIDLAPGRQVRARDVGVRENDGVGGPQVRPFHRDFRNDEMLERQGLPAERKKAMQ